MKLETRLWWDETSAAIHRDELVWNAPRHQWTPAAGAPQNPRATDPATAIRHLQASRPFRGLPMGVIGPKKASPEIVAMAEGIGAAIAALGVPLLCGGKSGVMEAACKGRSRPAA